MTGKQNSCMLINPKLAALMSPADQEYYQKRGELPDPKKSAKAIARNEREEQRVFSAWMHQERILFVNPRMDKESTIQPGHPDFSVFLNGGRTIFIEMKVEGGKLSPEQTGRLAQLREAGYLAEVCWSADEAIKLVRSCRHTNLDGFAAPLKHE